VSFASLTVHFELWPCAFDLVLLFSIFSFATCGHVLLRMMRNGRSSQIKVVVLFETACVWCLFERFSCEDSPTVDLYPDLSPLYGGGRIYLFRERSVLVYLYILLD